MDLAEVQPDVLPQTPSTHPDAQVQTLGSPPHPPSSPHSSQEWEAWVKLWSRSKESQALFCRAHGLCRIRFNYWKRKFLGTHTPKLSRQAVDPRDEMTPTGPGPDHSDPSAPSPGVASFLSVSLPQLENQPWACEIRWPQGICARFRSIPEEGWLRRLIGNG
jgi:hypothetical protein